MCVQSLISYFIGILSVLVGMAYYKETGHGYYLWGSVSSGFLLSQIICYGIHTWCKNVFKERGWIF